MKKSKIFRMKTLVLKNPETSQPKLQFASMKLQKALFDNIDVNK